MGGVKNVEKNDPPFLGSKVMGLVHNLLMQFSTPGSSKVEVFKTYLYDIVIT